MARSCATGFLFKLALAALAIAACAPAGAHSCFWSDVGDHLVTKDESGVWNPNSYRGMIIGLSIAQVGGALWEGSESRFGKTMWQGIDSEIISGVAAEAGKYIFTRVRPDTQNNPCLWFKGGSNHSFPSGEASVAAGLVTPYVIEYARDYPLAYGLLLIPLYVGAGRIKNQAHWQTDVIAGWAIGGVSGWYSHSRDVPILIELLPHGFAVGISKQF